MIRSRDNLRHPDAFDLRQNLGAVHTVLPSTGYETDLRRELEFHVDLLTLKYQRAGLSAAEARRHALIAFGGLEPIKEQCRDARPFSRLIRASRVLLAAARGR